MTVTLFVKKAPLTITASNDSKTYGQTKSYGTGQTTFTSSGLKNSETIGSVTITASGGTAGPFRVAEGLQVVSLCNKEGASGLPAREQLSQQLLLQKLDAAGRRYMRELRRQATIDVKQP